MRLALDPAGHRLPRTKRTCLLHTWRSHRQRPFALVLHLHQYQSSRNLHLQYLAKNQYTQRCQSLITLGSDHPPVLKPHMVLIRGRGVRSANGEERSAVGGTAQGRWSGTAGQRERRQREARRRGREAAVEGREARRDGSREADRALEGKVPGRLILVS
jgi:hypothetical protein